MVITKKLNVAQVGVGHDHAHDAVAFLSTCEDINFLGYVKFSSEEEVFNANKERYQGLKELTLDEVINNKDLDCVFIETDDRYLTEYALKFVERGIPVELDKPGSQDKKSFDDLFNLAKEKNVPIHMGYMYRYNPAVKKAKEILASGELGKVNFIDLDMSTFHKEEKRKWLGNFKGGMMNFLGCHLIDLLLSFQGEPDEVIPLNVKSNENVGEDIGFAKFKYGNYFSSVVTSAINPTGFPNRHINIYCEKGNIKIKPIELFKDGYFNVSLDLEKDGKIETIKFAPFKRYDEMYYEFFDIVNGKISNPYPYDYEIKLHDLILKACNYGG